MPDSEEKKPAQSAGESAAPGEGESVTKLEALVVRAVIDPDDPLGLLPTGTQTADLPVFIENRWPVYAIDGITDTVRVYWGLSRAEPIDSRKLDGPIREDQFPMEFTIPRNQLQSDGTFDIWYTVTNSFINLPTESEVTKVTIDTRPPGYDKQLEALLLPDDLSGGVITEMYLFDHDDKVVFRLPLPRYTDAQNGDTGLLFWSEDDPPTGAAVSSEVFLDVNGELTLTLSGDVIRAANKNGLFRASCKVRDRAGNESGFARSTPVTVSLTPWPVDLPAPTVPLHDDGLIHRADARTPVTIVIEHFDDAQPGDQVVFRWDGSDLLPQPANFPVTAEVPWAALIKNGPGPHTVQVSYRVLRGTGSIPSLSTPININLTVAGQDHPGAPALLNPLLALPDVYGQSAIRNELIPSDKGHPVIPVVVLYQNPVAGELLELHWGSWPGVVATYRVQPGDTAGNPVSFSAVPWEVIEAEPNNSKLPVYYTTSNGVNQQQSQNQFVKVQVVTIDDLPEPSFPGADKFGYINCGSEEKPWDGIRVRITFANDRFDIGDDIKLFWQGHEYLSPETPVIPETVGDFDEKLNASHIAQGFVDIVVKPYIPHIRPIREGAGNAWYTLNKNDGQFGRSQEDFVKIIRKLSESEDCEPPDDWEQ